MNKWQAAMTLHKFSSSPTYAYSQACGQIDIPANN
jgi:hypothetical protein